jgi:major capsid protein
MANATVSRLGQANGAGDALALFLKVFAGEVLTAFAESNVFMGRQMIRTIESGKSASFPATWKGTAAYHTPGTELVGSTVAHNERVISIDDLLVADRFIASIDEAMNHWDVRSEYSRDVGRALSKTWDKNVAQVALLAARASATVTGGNGGTAIVSATSGTSADAMIAAVADAVQALDEKDVPDEDRYTFLKPDQYYQLITSGSRAIQAETNADGPNGGVGSGKVYRLLGTTIVKTNNLPSTNVITGPAAYQGNFSTTTGLVCHRSATGTVKLIDLAVETAYDIRRQGDLIVGKYAVGHGILRPESSVEIKSA